jgi:hypothetical protein
LQILSGLHSFDNKRKPLTLNLDFMNLQPVIGKLPDLVGSISGDILSYALILASVATITMTFLELVKALFKLRLNFNENNVKAWLNDVTCYNELLVLTVADVDSADALFDQPVDKMMGQVQAAANVATDFPDVYSKFYDFLSKIPEPYASVNKNKAAGADIPSDAEVWKAYIASPDAGTLTPSDPRVQDAMQARARIDHLVARKLDAFQNRTSYSWARRNQYYAVLLSAIFLTGLLVYLKVPLLWAVVLAFFGGMIAPFAKDIVSGLSGIKTK